MKSLKIIILVMIFVPASQLFGASDEGDPSAARDNSCLADVHVRLAAAKKRFEEASACYLHSQDSVVVDPDLKYVDAYLAVAHELSDARMNLVTIRGYHDALGCQCEVGLRLDLDLEKKSAQQTGVGAQALPLPATGGLLAAFSRMWRENAPVLLGGAPG